VDAAVVEGRKAICLEFPNTLEWAAPVLYLRAAGGVLFNPQRPVASTRKSPPVVQVSPISDLRSAIKNLQASITLPLAPGVTLPLVLVPKGQFIMGSDKAKDKDAFDDELPQHKLFLDDYYIGKYPVTVAQFAAFVKAEKYQTSAEKEGYGWVWKDNKLQKVEGAYWQQPRGPGSSVARKMDHTVTQVSWDDACDFCAWASRVCQVQVRLPSEAEWEKAARGTDGRIYPWGKEPPDASRCNFDLNVGDTTPVGRYSPLGDSPYGCADMLGNVWEWTSSRWGKQWDKTDFPYPYRAGDGREDPESRDWRVLRGGAFGLESWGVRCACRFRDLPDYFYWYGGFRVCLPHSP
jgi:sulfatase modifying factor 1